MYTYMYTI